MALDLTAITPPTPPETKSRPRSRLRWIVAGSVGLATAASAAAFWRAGAQSRQFWEATPVALETLDVVMAPLSVVVVETGTVESASNTTIKCQVEALVGLVGGTTSGGARSGATGGAGGSSGASGGTAAATPSASVSLTPSTSKSNTAKSAAKKKASKSSASSSGSSEGGSAGGGGGGGGGGSGGGSGGGAGGSEGGTSKSSKSGGSASMASAGNEMTITQRPTIRSFSMTVTPYTSLQTKRSATTASTKSAGQGGSRGGSGGGGGGGGGGGNSGGDNKTGSTKIIMIREEGSVVAAGDVVCEFDSAAFRDAVLAQKIKADTAHSAMVQAQSILEVNQISLNEYRDGVYPQDLQLVRQYLSTCRTERERAQRNVNWSQSVLDKNFRAPQQHRAEVLSLQRAEIALVVAELMEQRLINATGPKLIRSLEAKLQANRADALALESAYRIEADRLKRLDKMVANCTLRAPHEGTVVYSMPQSNGWRPASPAIMEGATVREGQSIFELPDPKHMRIRAKVNESKVASIRAGQRVKVRVDAFPDRPLYGKVGDVTLIPAPAAGPMSDVKIYFANISVDEGNTDGLRPGLSAEVTFQIDDRPSVTQVPIKAVRWVEGAAYAAVATNPERTGYRWQPIEVGAMNSTAVEVTRGLKEGDHVVARPDDLPAPTAPIPSDGPAANPPALQAATPAGPKANG